MEGEGEEKEEGGKEEEEKEEEEGSSRWNAKALKFEMWKYFD